MPRDSPPHSSRPRSRSRSPRRPRDERYGSGSGSGSGFGDRRPRDRPQRGGEREDYRERDRERNRGGEKERTRDSDNQKGYNSRARDTDYTAQDRERERAADRQRFDLEKTEGEGGELVPRSPPKPNFGNSGLLAKESNMVKGVALKYHEPPEARKPTKNYRLYVFKGDTQEDLIHIYRQSCYLIGRDAVIVDIPVVHPSCSKQHAVIQYRLIKSRNEYGDVSEEVKPFIIDLDSTNGTYVNDQEVPKSRYYELRNKDVIKFGTSSREFVLLHEQTGK